MGQNCTTCFREAPSNAKRIQDIDLSLKFRRASLNTIKEDSLENLSETPIKTELPNQRPRSINIDLSSILPTQVMQTESNLPPIHFSQTSEVVYLLEDGPFFQGSLDESNHKFGAGVELINGNKYSGQFLNNKRHGFGRLVFASGGYYEGEFFEGSFEGKGKIVNLEGFNYYGDFKANRKHGKGREEWSDGSCFDGHFENGIKTGKGKFIWSDSSYYEGEFRNGKFHGYGVYEWSNGKKYEGMWDENRMHGKGKFTWPSGKIYVGEYENDTKHGFGTLTLKDGRKYSGRWENGKYIKDSDKKDLTSDGLEETRRSD